MMFNIIIIQAAESLYQMYLLNEMLLFAFTYSIYILLILSHQLTHKNKH